MTNKCRSAKRNNLAGISMSLMAGLFILSAAPPALAAPGGGGGGGGGSSSSAPRRQIDPAESFRQGYEAYQEGNYKKAEKKFREVLSVAKDHPETNYYMGMTKVKRGKAKSSRRYFERAVKERPTYVEAREQLALVYIELGDLDKAGEQLTALEAMVAACDTDGCSADRRSLIDGSVARVSNAMTATPDENGAETGDEMSDSGARAGQTAAMLLQPREAGVEQYQIAVRAINEQRYAEAIEDLHQAQGIIGPHPDVLNYLGFSHRKLMKFEKAEKYYRQALAINPDHLGANEYLGEMYLELGDLNKAKKQLAILDKLCTFGCAEREDLARLIDIKQSIRRAGE